MEADLLFTLLVGVVGFGSYWLNREPRRPRSKRRWRQS